MSYSEYSSLFTVIVNDNRYSENSRIAIPCTIRDNYSLIIINNTNSTYSDSVNQLNLNENSKDFVIPLLFYTFYKLIKKYKFLNLDRILSDFDEISANNGRLYYTRYREKFIFLSCLFVSNSVEDAYKNYYQTEKRCVIRDYWQWLGYEGVHEDSLDDKVLDITLDCRIISSYICPELGIIIPEDYLFNKNRYLLRDYGFDPKDGVWKPLNYKNLESQKENIKDVYNQKTCEIYELEETIYQFFKLQYETDIKYKAIIPIELTKLILRTYKDIKEYYEFLNNENKALSVENIIEEDEELEGLMEQVIKDKEQNKVLETIIALYFPSKEKLKPIDKLNISK